MDAESTDVEARRARAAAGVDIAAATDRLRVVGRLRELIATEQLEPGETLGTERGLAELLGVTRSPLRAALAVLEERGEIRRAMGRTGGVVVSDGKLTRHLNTVQSVPDMVRQHGLSPATRVLRVETGLPTRRETRLLRLHGSDRVVRITRRRDADGRPLSLDAMTLPAHVVPGWSRLDFSSSVYELLRREYGIAPAYSVESIDLRFADPLQAELLGVGVHAPLFEIRRITFDGQDRPIEVARDLFRADRTRISTAREPVGHSWKRAVRRPV